MKYRSRTNLQDANINVLIITPINVEYQGIYNLLLSPKTVTAPQHGHTYCLGQLQSKSDKALIRVALRKTGKGRLAVAESVQEGVALFQPKLVVLFGTAGGIKKVKIGDIVIGTAGYDYESGRVVDQGFYSNPLSLPTSRRMVEKAAVKAQHRPAWEAYLPESKQEPAIHFSPIASGDKVVASNNAPLLRILEERFHNALALEMESYAFLYAASKYPDIETLIVRGVSDLLGDKTIANQANSRERAVANAAAFLQYFLEDEEFAELGVSFKRRHWPISLAIAMVIIFATTWASWDIKQDPPAKLSSFPLTQVSSAPDDAPTHIESTTPASTKPSTPSATDSSTAKGDPLGTTTAQESSVPTKRQETITMLTDSASATEQTPKTLEATEPAAKQVPEERYDFNIYIFNQERRLLRGATYFINDEAVFPNGNTFQLPAGTHTLKVTYGNQPPLIRTINVPNYDNEQIRMEWDF